MKIGTIPKKVTNAIDTLYVFSKKREREILKYLQDQFPEADLSVAFHPYDQIDEGVFFLWVQLKKIDKCVSFRHPSVESVINAAEEWIMDEMKADININIKN